VTTITKRGEAGSSLTQRRVAHLPLLFLPVPEPWVPRPCAVCKGGRRCCLYYFVYHAARPASQLRRPSPALYHLLLLSAIAFAGQRPQPRPLPLDSEQTRERYRFVVVGYVVMPEHIHLLITEPEVGTPSTVMQVLKQRTARALLPKKKRADARQRRLFEDAILRTSFWQARFYDFNVWTDEEAGGKAEVHASQSGLVNSAEQWRWSSYRFYLLGKAGPVRVNEGWTKISFLDRVAYVRSPAANSPHSRPCKGRKDGAPTVWVMPARSKVLGHPP
jgi:REP element-mobilizing transposase RayT